MTERIIPRFKQNDYSKGILEGVRGLYQVALGSVPARPGTARTDAPVPVSPSSRNAPMPAPGTWSSGCGLILLIVVGLVVVSFVSRLFRRGVSSWGSGGPYYGRRYGGGYYGGGGGFGSSFGGGLLGGVLGGMLGNAISRPSGSS
jgi:uncharacterized membrane protein YgcG